ncbi:MAG TPA: hypothetical protein VLT36_03025 [Candidatus Dormibacteraeota bacterium]|nr:hypothetical protein [Candidatus Dormibacteraeota bacterium]
MAWFKKKPDPISDRARALNDEIAQLEAQIKKLDSRVQKDQPQSHPRLRSTAIPYGATLTHAATEPEPTPKPKPNEPIFEELVDIEVQKSRAEAPTTNPEHFNELGVRKYDLPGLIRKIRNHWQAPSTTNPKLVSYLAAGGIQGLRPMRYEKRVARNRFLALVLILFVTLLGIIAVFYHRR